MSELVKINHSDNFYVFLYTRHYISGQFLLIIWPKSHQ